MTKLADARFAIEVGANAIGINLWPGSSRFVPAADRHWLKALRGEICRVAVLVNPTLPEMLGLAVEGYFEMFQLHGEESVHYCADLAGRGLRLIKAVRMRDLNSLKDAQAFDPALPLLLDSFRAGMPGGTGQPFDWELAAAFRQQHPGRKLVLAGGLNFENVSAACRRVQPDAVDVASGIERPGNPGSKDHCLMRSFLEAVKTVPKTAENALEIFYTDTAKKKRDC